MKNPLTSLLILTLILGIVWIMRNPLIDYFFPCEGYGCIGSGILYLAIYGGVAVLGHIILLIWLYKSSGSFTKSFSFALLSVLILFGIIVTDGYFGKIEENKVMNDAYTDCIKTFSGKTRELEYCETYNT